MVQGSVGLLAPVPATLVHALNLLVAPARSLVLLRAGDGHKRIDGRQRVPALKDASLVSMFTRRPTCLHLLLAASVLAIPWLAQEDPMTRGVHSACQAGGTAQPIQVATRTWASRGAPGSAACRGEVCKASTAAGGSRLGWSRQRSMDL
jgi:hypothetical protein